MQGILDVLSKGAVQQGQLNQLQLPIVPSTIKMAAAGSVVPIRVQMRVVGDRTSVAYYLRLAVGPGPI